MQELSRMDSVPSDEDEFATDLKFYMQQIYLIIKPVVVCIVLSIFWVKVAFSGQSDYSPTRPAYSVLAPPNTSGSHNQKTPSDNNDPPAFVGSLTNAVIIIAQIITVTIIIVFLFRKGWIKVLIGFFMVIVLLLLGFMTYLLLLNLIQTFSIPLDYITMVFAVWNFAIVGLVSIFWKGPLWLQQIYLTIMSSLMAFSLTGLEQWTTWILLGLLAVWDLIAVLCPFGPLRLLIESSRSQQQEVPALLYSVNAVWFMLAPKNHFQISFKPSKAIPLARNHCRHDSEERINTSQNNSSIYELSTTSSLPLQASQDISSESDASDQRRSKRQIQLQQNSDSAVEPSQPICTATSHEEHSQDTQQIPEVKDEVEAERNGLKLGLGDFVFYSVLIARAAMYDWITTVCCTIAVLTGLTATIFLLAIYKKALPALPISIAFGILFFFVSKTILVPYIAMLCVSGMVGI